jgi:FKBP-type peptidyl-prolyl cis-trans isomerase FkpA
MIRVSRLIALAALLATAACGSVTPTVPTPPGAPYSTNDLVVGTGTLAAAGNTVTVQYTGWLYDPTKTDGKGAQFDSNTSFQIVLGTGAVIAGFDQGITGMRVGGTRRIIIPPDLGYGSTANGAIPANSTLVFEVTLLSVQ